MEYKLLLSCFTLNDNGAIISILAIKYVTPNIITLVVIHICAYICIRVWLVCGNEPSVSRESPRDPKLLPASPRRQITSSCRYCSAKDMINSPGMIQASLCVSPRSHKK
jgi:hypothetical protein